MRKANQAGGLRASLITFVLVAAAVTAFAYYQLRILPERAMKELASRPIPPIWVSTEEASLEEWPESMHAIATLEAANGVDVAAEVAGVITGILFESGQSVEAGAPLIQLDDQVLRAELKEVQAQLRNAEVELERIRRLAQDNMTSKSDLDSALSRRDEAAAAVERVRARIAQKSIRAPFSGRLGVRLVQQGQYIEENTPVVTLQHANPIYANFSLPESALSLINVGDPVELQVDSYPGEKFLSKVSSFDPKVDQQSRTFLVQATLDNEQMKLVPGQFANVEVEIGEAKPEVTIPDTAVLYSLYGDTVYVVQPPNAEAKRTVEQRLVRIGGTKGDRVGVLEGIRAGEEIVALGAFKLRNGAAVEINNSYEQAPFDSDSKF